MDSVYLKRSDVIAQLRGVKGELAYYMRPGQSFVNIKHVDMRGLTPAQLRCNEIQLSFLNGETFVRATYGHKGEVATRMNYGQYVPYTGHNDIFCMTHFSNIGLGDVNHTRTYNILMTPDMVANKGCIGYISVSQSRLKGVEFWSKVGDRYGNKIFCFDPELRECFYSTHYTESYGTVENLCQTHSAAIANYSRFMPIEKAVDQTVRLFIDDAFIESGESEEDYEEEAEDLSAILQEVLIV